MASTSTWILSLKVLFISTGVLSLAFGLKVSVPLVLDFSVSQAPVLWSSVASWLRPPFLYVIINAIIITIVASSRFHRRDGDNEKADHQQMPVPKITVDPNLAFECEMKSCRSDFGAAEPSVVVFEQKQREVVEAGDIVEDKNVVAEDLNGDRGDELVTSKSEWNPLRRMDSSEIPMEILSPAEKPLVSARFGHRKLVNKASTEGFRSLGVAKPKRHETMENTRWCSKSRQRRKEATLNLEKSATEANMADLILGPLVDVTTSKVISVTIEQLNLAVGFKQELKKFRVVLRMLRGVLQDAEQKEVTSHFDLQDWLKELGNIVDEVDNVVDEMAYEHLRHKWESLRSSLLGIGNNIRIRVLVTTRSENVASTMGTLSKHKHHLEKLTDEDCWSIIKQRALVSSSLSPELERIGRDIGSKCRGLVLVANVIGGSLCNNRKKDDWLSIKDNSEEWGLVEEANGVLPMLQLSFNCLPTPVLKQRFAFCSIFPKDYVMEKEMLIQL
ncbi:hypothetical protein SLEP1_g52350 [Rubroshorea leprosula]|uniref:DUF4408 domain-containing protein n=1 Tax=Rubroshorea leprosula TaxID=152421 RepID=A0AAV5M651_9ROSI|nr:hypothetical protein SLEP1_g52350 [Rubroshorea leprosula]